MAKQLYKITREPCKIDFSQDEWQLICKNFLELEPDELEAGICLSYEEEDEDWQDLLRLDPSLHTKLVQLIEDNGGEIELVYE